MVPGLTAGGPENHLRLVSGGIVEAAGMDDEDFGNARECQINR